MSTGRACFPSRRSHGSERVKRPGRDGSVKSRPRRDPDRPTHSRSALRRDRCSPCRARRADWRAYAAGRWGDQHEILAHRGRQNRLQGLGQRHADPVIETGKPRIERRRSADRVEQPPWEDSQQIDVAQIDDPISVLARQSVEARTRVSPLVAERGVHLAEQRGQGGYEDHRVPARPQDAKDLAQSRPVVFDVFEHIDHDNAVTRSRWQIPDVMLKGPAEDAHPRIVLVSRFEPFREAGRRFDDIQHFPRKAAGVVSPRRYRLPARPLRRTGGRRTRPRSSVDIWACRTRLQDRYRS